MPIDEDSARRLLLVQAWESGPETPLWTAEDRAWATRAAAQESPAAASHERFLAARANLALQRLAPREARVRRVLERRLPWGVALATVVGLGLVLGAASDALLGGATMNLLSPVFFGLLGWNLVLYLVLAVAAFRAAPAGPLRRGLAARVGARLRRLAGRQGPLADFARRWNEAAWPLTTARVTVGLHALAAALALGLVAGGYLRALVFDYRAGWATTLLGTEVVHALLAGVFAPASALTGLPLPDAAGVAALRVTPAQPATASAAPWLHLSAVTLALGVVLPRLLLAAAAAWRAQRLARDFPLSLTGPYFDRLRPPTREGAARVLVVPHALTPTPAATLGLRALLAGVFGDAVRIDVAATVAHGDEEEAALPDGAAAAGTAPAAVLTVLLADLAATPEAEAHGLLLQRLPPPRAVLLDEAGFVQRFGRGARRDERRAAWAAFARDRDATPVVADLADGDPAAAAAALRAALDG